MRESRRAALGAGGGGEVCAVRRCREGRAAEAVLFLRSRATYSGSADSAESPQLYRGAGARRWALGAEARFALCGAVEKGARRRRALFICTCCSRVLAASAGGGKE